MKRSIIYSVITLMMAVAIDANAAMIDDTQAELFYLTDANGNQDDATVFLLDLQSQGSKSIGIYDATTQQSLEVFSKGTNAISSATLSWDIASGVVTNLFSGESASINYESFGFFNGDWMSQPDLNAGGLDHLAVFDVGGLAIPEFLGSNLVLQWSAAPVGRANSNALDNGDWLGVSDIDYVRAAVPVPEPSMLMLLGAGLLGVFGYRRREA